MQLATIGAHTALLFSYEPLTCGFCSDPQDAASVEFVPSGHMLNVRPVKG